jgi:hypothetical protein
MRRISTYTRTEHTLKHKQRTTEKEYLFFCITLYVLHPGIAVGETAFL